MTESENMKVLVVDDEQLILDFVRRFLRRKGFDVAVSPCGEDALKKLESFVPDVLILDIGMNGMDGYELARRVKAKPELADVPIVFLSGFDVDTDNARSFLSGGSVYIRKPIRGEVLVEALQAVANTGKPESVQTGGGSDA